MGICTDWRQSRLLTLSAVAFVLSACGELEPCGALDLAGTGEFRAQASTILALSDSETVSIIHGDSAEVETITIRNGSNIPVRPNQILLTASGRWLTYRVGSDVFSVDLDDSGDDLDEGRLANNTEPKRNGFEGIDEIIGALRGGDWLIYRNEGTAESRSSLWALYVGDPAELPEDHPQRFQLGPGDDLRVVAIGHRHIVARKVLDDEHEELYLLRIAPARQVDYLGAQTTGHALRLTSGKPFNRVIITDGPSPADRGHDYEFQHTVPTDAQVIATSGDWPSARTVIYSVADLSEVANFDGAVITSQIARENVSGLNPVSPDGSHLAYIARSGAVALRNLETHGSCMVRSGVSTTHKLAGFGADSSLYFESVEGDIDHEGKYRDAEQVYTYDTWSRALTRLTRAGDKAVWRLLAVPSGPDSKGKPWAVVGADGAHIARPEKYPSWHSASGVSFLPRNATEQDDESPLWMIESEPETYDGDSRLLVTKVNPEGDDELVHAHPYSPNTSVCVSTSQSSSWTTPWATRCSSSDDPGSFLDNGLPESEHGP